ncbi:MAG: hypothetical protein JWQ71_1350 [Pedosphaera sp.]|nr:hypothetical protein [Pedosphaera sp.]
MVSSPQVKRHYKSVLKRSHSKPQRNIALDRRNVIIGKIQEVQPCYSFALDNPCSRRNADLL